MFIESILDQASLKSSSLCQLKKLNYLVVNFSLNSIQQLNRSTDQWDDLLVITITCKLDVDIRRERDKKSCTLKEITNLTEFMNLWINILERFESLTSKRDIMQERSRSSRNSHHVNQVTNKVNCRICLSVQIHVY